jgi:hypothetical protein
MCETYVLQDGCTSLHLTVSKFIVHLDTVQYLVQQCGADLHAKDSKQRTALDYCTRETHEPIAAFLRLYMEPKPKMFALCMGLHRRLGVDSPLNMLNVDVMQEIAKHLPVLSVLKMSSFYACSFDFGLN